MKVKLSSRFAVFSFALCLSLLAGCGAATDNGHAGKGLKIDGREVAVGERFKLEKDEKVWVKDTPLTVELKSVRRTWYVDGKSETADADIIITLDNKEQRQWMDIGEKLTVGDYTIECEGADPFGKTDAKMVVTRR